MKHLVSLGLLLILGIWAKAQTVTFTLNQQPCNNNGIVTATFTGLTTPISVTYYINNTSVSHTTNTTTDVLNNYSGQPMYVVAVGANNVTAYGQFAAPPFTINVSTTPAACPALGSATATITGGAAPYNYQWIELATSNTVGTTSTVNLPSGGYKLIVTDANGCVFSNDSIAVYSNSPFSVTLNTTPASCTNGSATISNINAGTPPFSYLWSNGATTSGINNLVKGSYNVAVTDANGCVAMGYAYISQNPNINVNVTTTPATCVQTNGGMTAFGSGGTPPYTYQWSNSVNTQSQSNIAAGLYTVDVTDANGCTGIGYASVTSSTPITVTQSATPSSCTSPTGSASLAISGGVPPYTINWSTFPAQTGTTATNLAPGTYAFNIVDANGCIRNGSVNVPPVNVISANISATLPTCVAANGSLTVSATGGTAPYTYLWSNSGTTASINNLAAGNYSVTITDNAGCSVTKHQSLASSTPITLGFNTTQASCIYANDGSTIVTPVGGATPYTYSWSNSANTAAINNLTSGNYWVTVSDANGCTKSGMAFVPYNAAGTSCYCTITGTVYDDANNNCTKDPGEAGIPNIQIHCSGFGYTYTNANGVYSFKVPSGSYTLSENVLAYYPLASCQNNNVALNVTATTGCTQTVNFANTINPIHDMHISTWDYNMPVPGFNYNMVSIISNQGTVTEATAIGGLQPDNQLSAPTFNPSNVFTGSNNWYTITSGNLNLTPGTSKLVSIDYAVPANIPLNTSLVFKDSVAYTGPISNWLNDYSPWNNVNYFTSLTVGSYDPNFKEVLPKGSGTNGLIYAKDSVLEYMVHFQNVGTYYAQKVVVVDTLDADLDWSTLRPIYQSHPCSVTMNENGVVTFTFNNINLPPAIWSEDGSNGMLTYTIETKPSLALGTQFTNNAAIYFDYNEPIITNTTLNTLGVPQGIQGVANANEDFTIYPNPANKMFYAQISSNDATIAVMNITDVSGKQVMQQTLKLQGGTQNISVDVASLTPGLYFVSVVNNGKSSTQKLVIMK